MGILPVIHPELVKVSIRSWGCLWCLQPVAPDDPDEGWYWVPGLSGVVHDGGCWWGYNTLLGLDNKCLMKKL